MAKIGSVLASGQSLAVGDYLISPDGRHVAQMQGDGNFVLYYSDPKTAALADAYWASNTARATGQYVAILQGDGNFVLYHGNDPQAVTAADAYWASNTALGPGQYVAILQNDGNLALYHGSDPGGPGPLYWSSLPQAVVQSKFMQNYRVSSPVNGGDDVVAVCNSLGQTELFTIGKEGDVHTIFPDSGSETGYNEARITTGLHVTSLAAGLDSQGRTIVLAAATPGPALYYVVEDTKSTPRWSTPQKVGNLPVPSGATALARIIAQEIADNLYVALAFTMQDGTCSICSSIWQTDSPTFQTPAEPTFMLSNPNGIWQGSTAKDAAYVSFPYLQGAAASQVWLYFPSTNSMVSGAAHLGSGYSNRQVVSIDSTLDASGTSQVFVVLDDGNTYRLIEGPIGQYGGAQFSWLPLGQGMPFQQVVVETDRSGNPQVFVLSQPNASHLNVLSQWIPEADSPTGYAALPIPIHEGTGLQLAGVRNDGGSIDLFCVDAYNHITHLFQEEESGTWVIETVETPGGSVEEYASYATDVTLYDSMGEVLVDTPVSISASEEARITVNGATFFIDDHRPAHIRSNSAGLLSISQETGSLATPSLQIKVLSPQWLPTIPDIVVKPYTGVQQSLVDVTPETLLQAKLPDGTPLLDEQYHTQQDAESVAAAIKQCMGMMGAVPKLAAPTPAPTSLHASPPSPNTSPHLRTRHPMAAHYTHARSSRPAAHQRLLPAPEKQQHWRLSFEGGHASYQELSQPEAAQLFADTQSTLQSASSVLDFFSDLADIVQGAFEEILRVTEIVVQTVEDGLKTMITFVIGDQTCFFEAVISFVEQVFDLVEAVFTSIAVFFEKLYKWLAWLFSWPDILRSKEALSHTIEQYLEYLQGAASGYKRLVDANFAMLKSQVADWFQQARDAVAQSSIGGYLQLNGRDDPVFLSAISNNFLLNELMNNLFGTPVLDWLMAFFAEVANSAAPQALSGLASQVEGDPAFSAVVDFFLKLVESPGQLFSILLKDAYGAVEMLVQAALSGMQSLVDTLMDAAASLVLSVRNTLNKPWNIPFVSQFYAVISNGDELTTLDLISLIMAIPTTILYKLTYNDAAPFPDAASVSAFKNSFKASQMLQASAFPTASATLLASSIPAAIELPETALLFLAMGYMVSQAVGGVTTSLLDLVAIPDALPSEQLRDLLPLVPNLTYIDYIATVCSVACRFELFYTEAVWDCRRAAGLANWNYALVGIFSYVVFSYFASQGIVERGLPSSDTIAILTSIAGGISLVLSSVAASTGEEDPAKSVWRIMLSMPWLFKFLRHSKLAIRTEGDSLVLLAVIDGACYVPGAILGFTVLTP